MSGDILNFILWLVLGGAAGWIAGQIMRGGGFGLIGNIIVGIIGAFIGGALANYVLGWGGVGFNIQGLLTAVVGAIILLFVVGLIRKA